MTGEKGTIKMLLVDDETGYLAVLTKRLAKRGVEVTAAKSGSEGIQALRRADFDIAVVDLKMDDLNGIEVLKIFKKMVPTLPVIMLTGHGSEQAAREGLAMGAFDYLNKPCELETLMDRIKAALGNDAAEEKAIV